MEGLLLCSCFRLWNDCSKRTVRRCRVACNHHNFPFGASPDTVSVDGQPGQGKRRHPQFQGGQVSLWSVPVVPMIDRNEGQQMQAGMYAPRGTAGINEATARRCEAARGLPVDQAAQYRLTVDRDRLKCSRVAS